MKLRIVTVATKEIVDTDYYQHLKNSLNKITFDHEFITLGSKDKWNGGDLTNYPGGGKKVVYLKEYLNSTKFDYDDYILFCDGSDTFCNLDISESDIESILPNELIFASEASYWPDWDLRDKFIQHSSDRSFLNSGLFVGRTNYVKELLNEYDLLEYDYENKGAPELVDDQYYYQNIYLDNQNKISLDYNQFWFECLGPLSEKTKENGVGDSKFVHGNGDAKLWYEENIINNIVPDINDIPPIEKVGVSGPSLKKSNIGCYVITIHPEETRKRIQEIKDNVPVLQNVDIIIMDGFRGENLTSEVLEENNWKLHPWKLDFHHLDWYNRDINDMEVGCALSHALVWDKAVENDFDFTFVFEEDFVSAEVFDLDLYKFPDEVDLIYMNRIKNEPDALELPYKTIEGVEWSYPSKSYNTSSYILSRKGAKSLQDQHLYDKIMPADEFLCACYGKANRHDLQSIIFPDLVAIATQDHSDWFKQIDAVGVDEGIHKRPNFKSSMSPALIKKDWNLLIDPTDKYLYEIPFLSQEWCSWLITEAEEKNKWTEGRHDFYATYDILLEKLNPKINEHYSNALQEYMVNSARYFYQLEGELWDNLRFENFVVKYSPETQPALGVHHDSSLISTVLTLNDKSEFEGGGTWFPRQELLHFGKVGHLSVHPGNITHKHGARPVTSGNRYVLITFSNYENKD